MNLKVLTPDHPDIPAIKALHEEAFPANERIMSMDTILANMDKLPVKLLGVYPDETPDDIAGFFLSSEGENCVYLIFLAIFPEKRSGGIGSKAMNAVREYYAGKLLLFSYESIYEECDNAEQRVRRRNLYLRLGFYETGWYTKLNGTEFVFASNEPNVGKDEILQFMAGMAAGTPGAKVPELYRRD